MRTTISLDPEVHAVFVSMAEAAGISVSRCMGDWLADTAEGAQLVALKMREARQAPRQVMREMQSMARGLVDEVDSVVAVQVKEQLQRLASGRAKPPAGQVEPSPPSSNTGGKVPRKLAAVRGGKSA